MQESIILFYSICCLFWEHGHVQGKSGHGVKYESVKKKNEMGIGPISAVTDHVK